MASLKVSIPLDEILLPLTPQEMEDILEINSTEQFDELFQRMCEEQVPALQPEASLTEEFPAAQFEELAPPPSPKEVLATKLDKNNYPLNGRWRHQMPWHGLPIDPRRKPADMPRCPMYLDALVYDTDGDAPSYDANKSSCQPRHRGNNARRKRSQRRLEEFIRKKQRVV